MTAKPQRLVVGLLPYKAPRVLDVYVLQGKCILERFSLEVDVEDFEDGGNF